MHADRIFIYFVLSFLFLPGRAEADTLRLDKVQYTPGETIHVRFEAESYADAWAGIVPSSVEHGQESINDQNDVEYRYLNGETQGVLEFQAPAEPGRYDVRLNDSDNSGRETAHVSFVVARPDAAEATLALDSKRYAPGAALAVSFTAPAGLADDAWVGIVPAEVPHGEESVNDLHDIAYQHLNGDISGRLQFTAPATEGRWTVRLHNTDSSGRELTSVPFQVGGELDAAGMAEQIATTGRTPVYGIRFESGQANLTSRASGALSEVAKLLRENPDLRLRIEGHTDDRGGADVNMALSVRRAESVLQHLTAVHGIQAGRLTAVGRGAGDPVSKNDTAAGRAQNRRVELVKVDA
ncbi:MAG: OmpA family protein [Thermoanaerobaculia bacterium]|nr:OmpA family protein [Thermoanaerobaculia bacterium]